VKNLLEIHTTRNSHQKSTELTSPPEPSKTIAQNRSARHSTRPTAHPPPKTRPAQPLNQRSHQTRLTTTKPETAENSKIREPPHPRETTENSTETADSFTKTGRVHQKRLRIPQKQPTCRETKRLTGNGREFHRNSRLAATQERPTKHHRKKGTAEPSEKKHRTTRDIIKQNTKGIRRKSSEITPGPSDTVNNQKIEKLEEP